MRDISGEVGILAGSLYSHIESKQELLAEILRRYPGEAQATLESREHAPLTTRDTLRGVFAVYFRMISNAPSQARVAVHDFRSPEPHELEASRQRRRDTQDIVVRILGQGIEQVRSGASPRSWSRRRVFSITNWAVEWYDTAGPIGPDEAAAFFADLLVDGVAPGTS